MSAQHTPGPLMVRMDGTCSGAWAEIGQECVDPVTGEMWWRELGRVETTHVERRGPKGRPLPGPVGTITETPERFVPTEDSAEHLANARLWAASPQVLSTAARAERFIAGFEDDDQQEGVRELLEDLRAAIAKATGSA